MTKQNLTLPKNCHLRPATAKDIWQIRKLVFGAKLDPTQLRYQQFWVIESENKIVACGQLRTFEKAQELGSLVVASAWRNRGLGTFLSKHLIREAIAPLYLECLGKNLEKFYTRLGFVTISWEELPQSLKFKFGLSEMGRKLLKIPVVLMEYRGVK